MNVPPGDQGAVEWESPARLRLEPAPRRGVLLVAMSMVISFLAAAAAPTPLYAHYDAVWHRSVLTTTIAFAVYAVAVALGLLILGEVSNHLGRVPVLLVALAVQAVALVLFTGAESYLPIFIGRVLQGLAAGTALGTLGAVMIEAHRERGTVASAAAPGVGTGSGALLAGLLVGFLPWPTHLVYLVLLAVFAVQTVALLRLRNAPELGRPRQPGLRASLRPTVAVPAGVRGSFAVVAPLLFAVWALAGFFSSIGPVLIRDLGHHPSVVLGGLGLFLLAGVAGVATVLLSGTSVRTMLRVGIGALLVGLAALLVAVLSGSVTGLLVSTAIAGVSFGSAFQGGIRTIVSSVEAADRPGLLSAIYLVSYAGFGLPAVVAGVVVSQGLAVTTVAFGYLAALLVLTLIATAALARSGRRTTRAAEAG